MIYFNNAATSYPKPPKVLEKVKKYLETPPLSSGRSNSFYSNSVQILAECRKNLANLLDIKNPSLISFTSGATESLNLAILGLAYQNQHFITSVIEHNSVLRPLKTLENKGEIALSLIECDENGMILTEEIEKNIKKNTLALVINHCSNVTGALQDLKEISNIAKEHGILLIVDASQSMGSHLFSLKEIPLDILVFTGHKGLFGLEGIGGIYIREGLRILPLKTGGTGTESQNLLQPEKRPDVYEAGTMNMTGILSLSEGVSFILEEGADKIRKRKTELTDYLVREMLKINNIRINAPFLKERSGIVSFQSETIGSEDMGYILEAGYGIIARTGVHCAPLIHDRLGNGKKGSVRISLSYFTKEEEIEFFLKALKEIQKNKFS
ncbi:MAG TPA: cysteine desulfurase [Spirochaetia bacterium]|nr:MAG: hypothetical protein A2Y41_13890 [Spirochaetes bacterium GWB1_36_13]HCL55738.1 cysteine desulfurase [Spirochaetia bacterium]